VLINTVLSTLPTAPEPAGDNSNYPDDDDIGPDGGYDMEEDQVSERALGHSKIYCSSVKGTVAREV
jgi:hypothetical protein